MASDDISGESLSGGRITYLSAVPYVKAALVVWFAEIVIGTLPLAAHLLITLAIDLPTGVAQLHESGFLPEECIVIVVISGLALVSVFEFEPRAKPLKTEPTTCFMLLAALVSLMFSSMFYGFATAEIVLKSQSLIHSFLGTAIAASLAVAVRKAHGERDADAGDWEELFSEPLVGPEPDTNVPRTSPVIDVRRASPAGTADKNPLESG